MIMTIWPENRAQTAREAFKNHRFGDSSQKEKAFWLNIHTNLRLQISMAPEKPWAQMESRKDHEQVLL